MNDARPELHAQLETTWKIINLQADTALKLKQGQFEATRVLIAGFTAAGALIAATVAVMKIWGGKA
jgi:hypothetical protein